MSNPRWKVSERRISTRLQAAAGRVTDAVSLALVTVTGRVGHLTELGFDILVGNGATAICGEAKRRKTFLGADAGRALLQVIRIAHEWKRRPVMGFTLADDVPAFIPTRLGKLRIERDYTIFPLSFAEELLYARRFVDELGEQVHFTDWMAAERIAAEDAQRRMPVEEMDETGA